MSKSGSRIPVHWGCSATLDWTTQPFQGWDATMPNTHPEALSKRVVVGILDRRCVLVHCFFELQSAIHRIESYSRLLGEKTTGGEVARVQCQQSPDLVFPIFPMPRVGL